MNSQAAFQHSPLYGHTGSLNRLDPVQRKWIDRSHAEAISINRQLTATRDLHITSQHIVDLNRFCECADDGCGYDVPRERMHRLTDIGLIEHIGFAHYRLTDMGDRVRGFWFEDRDNG